MPHLRQCPVFDSSHDLVIDTERAHIEVRRPNKDGVIDDRQFGVHYLRLVLRDLHSRTKKTAVERPRCSLRQRHIGYPSKKKPHGTASAYHHPQSTTKPIPGREIGGDDIYPSSTAEIVEQPPVENVPPKPRTRREHELAIVASKRTPKRRVPPATQTGVLEIVVRKQDLERLTQRGGSSAAQFEPQIEPATRHSITVVFRCDIEPAEESYLVVDQQKLPVITDRQST